MHACQSPTTVYLALSLPVSQREVLPTIVSAIPCRTGCLARSSCAYRPVWSAAATLPRQPCSRSGAWHTVDPAGCKDIVGARHDHSVGQECA
ncbi:MAG TPA: hypothetical protein DEF43_04005 [Chloroflexus aurantiacus]|nr:hypothetical protein [Chloroflexus aurantiacus]